MFYYINYQHVSIALRSSSGLQSDRSLSVINNMW